MNDKPETKIGYVSPLKRICMTIGELPTSYLETMTYYEMLIWFTKFLQEKVIPTIDNNAQAVEELQHLFIELQSYVNNYFDNLDVQDEINNKLDQMLEDGVLEQIIEQYLNSSAIWGFDTVADMKEATNLIDGSYAKTLGYHTKNDGGSAIYKIRNINNSDIVDGMFIIPLNNSNLIAELIYDEINIRQLGAKGNGISDDTNYLKKAFSFSNISLYIPKGTYIINESLILNTNTYIHGDGSNSILKCNTTLNDYLIKIPITSRFCVIKNIYIDGNYLCNGIYDGLNRQPNIQTRTLIENCYIYKCIIGIYLNSIGSNISNNYLLGEYTLDNSGRCETGIYINSTDNKIYNNRIGGFNNYGLYCNNSSNNINNVKCSLNGTGFYFKGDNISANIEAQENFNNNIKIYRVYGSNFSINSGGAGIIRKNNEQTIPTTLTEYSLIDIEESNSTIINCSLLSRQSYGETWSCEGNILKIRKCIALTINGSSYTGILSSAMPQLINADTITGNDIKINSVKITNQLRKRNVIISGTSNVTLNYQDNNNYNITINPTVNNTIALINFPYNECDNISIFNNFNELIILSGIYFRYTINGTNKLILLDDNVRQINTSNSSSYRIIENISNTLLNNAIYQEDLNSGLPITDKRIFLNSNLSNYQGNRTNINGILEVYYD